MDMASHSKKFFAGIACLLFVFSASMGFLGTQIYEGNYNFSEPESRSEEHTSELQSLEAIHAA